MIIGPHFPTEEWYSKIEYGLEQTKWEVDQLYSNLNIKVVDCVQTLFNVLAQGKSQEKWV